MAKRCPLRVQLDLVEPAEPLQPTADIQTRLNEAVAFWGIRRGRAAGSGRLRLGVRRRGHICRAADRSYNIGARRQGWRLLSEPVSPNDTAVARSGAPDVLVCARGGYVAVDVKHHRTVNVGDAVLLTSTLAVPTPTAATPLVGSELRADQDDALQLAHYRRMLQTQGRAAPTSLGGIIGKEQLVVWYDLDEAMWTTGAKETQARS